LQSTLGNERLFSPALKDRTQELFTDWLLGSLSDPPRYYAYLKKVNATGAPLRGATPLPAARNVDEFASLATERETVVIDTRGMEAWAAGHVQGALNLPADEHFPMWLGSVVDPEAQILLIAEDQHALADVVAHAYRIGYDHLLGYLHGGMAAWEQAGREVTHSELISVHQLAARLGSEDLTVLDVRTNGERAGGYIPGSLHIPANQIARRAGELDPSMPVVTYCGTGYRATVAASLLRRAGLEQAWAVPGSYRAWTAAGLEVAHDASDGAIQSAPQEVERTHQPGGIRR
jgi:hydroxyacylglutathione hydrolase